MECSTATTTARCERLPLPAERIAKPTESQSGSKVLRRQEECRREVGDQCKPSQPSQPSLISSRNANVSHEPSPDNENGDIVSHYSDDDEQGSPQPVRVQVGNHDCPVAEIGDARKKEKLRNAIQKTIPATKSASVPPAATSFESNALDHATVVSTPDCAPVIKASAPCPKPSCNKSASIPDSRLIAVTVGASSFVRRNGPRRCSHFRSVDPGG